MDIYGINKTMILEITFTTICCLLMRIVYLQWFFRYPSYPSAAEILIAAESEEPECRYRLTAKRLSRSVPENGFDVIFVGSGPSSLSCAALLSQLQYKCAVFEQGEELGGGCHVFKDIGYEFETGNHYLGPEMQSVLDSLSRGSINLRSMGTVVNDDIMYDNIIIAGDEYPMLAGFENQLRVMLERFPDQENAIRRFFEVLKFVKGDKYSNQARLFYVLKAVNIPIWFRRMLQRKLCKQYIELLEMTIEELMDDCGVKVGSRLASVLMGQYGDTGERPDRCSAGMHLGVMGHYIDGAVYPDGGSGAIPRKLNNVIRAAGGRSFVQARVTDLLVKKGRCRGVVVNGIEIEAPIVVCGASSITGFELLSKHLPDVSAMSLRNINTVCSTSVCFSFLFVSLDIPTDVVDNRSHNSWIYPRDDFTVMEQEIGASEPFSKILPMFVASGSEKDGTWKSRFGKNKKTIVVLTSHPYEWVERWSEKSHSDRENDEDYQNFKEKLKEHMMEHGFNRIYPNFDRYIVRTTVATPLSTNNFLATRRGECYGLAPTPERYMIPDLSPTTPLPGYFLTGQDIITHGIMSGLLSGILTANVIEGYGSYENVLMQRDIIKDMA